MSSVPAKTSNRHAAGLQQWSRPLMGAAIVAGLLGIGLIVMGLKLPALAALALAGGLILLLHPDVATLITTLVLYTNAAAVATQFHGIPKVAAAGLFLLLAVPLYYQIVVQRKQIVIAPAAPLLTLFVVVQLIGMLLALRSDAAVAVVITTFSEGLVLFLLVTNVIREKALLRHVIWVLLAAGTFMGGLSIVQQVKGDFNNTYGGFAQVPVDESAENPYAFEEAPRASGPIGEKNYYAQFLLLLVPLGLTIALSRKAAWRRWAAAIATAIIALAIAFTASRAAVLAGGVLVVTMVALRQIRVQHVVILSLCAMLIALASPQLRERMTTMIQLANFAHGDSGVRQVDKSTQGRFSEMYAAVLIFADNPLQGVGPGNFPSQFLKKADALGFQVHGEERMAHCAVLEIAAENGIFGLLCIVAIMWVSFRQLWLARRVAADPELQSMATAFLVVLVVLVFTSLFLSFAYVRYYWFILALAAVAARLARASASEATQPALPAAVHQQG